MESETKVSQEKAADGDLPSREDGGRDLPSPPPEIFVHSRDAYNTRYIQSKDLPADAETFRRRMETTLGHFKEQKVKGVFLELSLEQHALVGPSKELGFTFHHAEDQYLTMQKWVPDTPSKLPHYATHYVGVGGLVIDFEAAKVLVIQERSGRDTMTWKVPGGLVDNGEYVGEAAEREVREETGVLTTFKGVVAIREKKDYNFGRNDIYLVCLLEPKTKEIHMDEVEIAKCRWIDIEEWATHEFSVGIQELICKLAQDMIKTYQANKKDSKHLDSVWQSKFVHVNLATFKGTHLAYVPQTMIGNEKEEVKEKSQTE